MRIYSIAFLLGILLLQNFSALPDKKWVWIIFIICVFFTYWKSLRIFVACALGFSWCLWYAHQQMSWSLPESLEGKPVIVTGRIVTIPNASQQNTSFLFETKTLEFDHSKNATHSMLRLSWQHKKEDFTKSLHIGDDWQLMVKLKKIHGTLNPGGFDYEAWALHEGIRAKGYVVNHTANKLINSKIYHNLLGRIREYFQQKINANLPQSNTSPWISALSLGERHGIAQENWEILRNTGTNHLMAIAGLHIGFMSGFAFSLVAWCWKRIPHLSLRFPAQHAGAIAALLMALIYSALAGFSIPTQRACIMLTVFLMILLLRRKMISWHAWSIALFTVLLINPLSVLTESFWLSFGAVAFIIYGVSGRLSPSGWWWKWGRIQWVIAIGLIPLSLWLFQQFSIVSFIANSIAIPWVGFLIVPLCLLGTFSLVISEKLGGLFLWLADKQLSWLWSVLTGLAHVSWSSWFQSIPSIWVLLGACIGFSILLLPIGFPGRFLGLIWVLPLFFYSKAAPLQGEIEFTLLDVGQGLSAVVQTQKHLLIFDTGAKLSPDFDMGESVIVPYLRSIGAKKIDMLVISHGDNDHIGGAHAILNRFPVLAIKTSVPEKLPSINTSYCLRNQSWEWDGVTFEFLYPTPENLNLGNDSSCVLKISRANKSILLTGDIEKYAEKNLIAFEQDRLPANILVAPHHGSKTSAVDDFVKLVHPQYVLFPIGYRNRYHFPHPSVIAKYDALKIKKIDTVRGGAIKFRIKSNGELMQPMLYRMEHHRYWYDV